MSFDWEKFGEGVTRAGDQVAGFLAEKEKREWDEASKMRMFKNQLALTQTQWMEQQKVEEANKEILQAKAVENELSSNIKLESYRAGLKQSFDSPQFQNETALLTQSPDPSARDAAKRSGDIINRLQAGQNVTPEEKAYVQGLYSPQAFAPVARLIDAKEHSDLADDHTRMESLELLDRAQYYKAAVANMGEAAKDSLREKMMMDMNAANQTYLAAVAKPRYSFIMGKFNKDPNSLSPSEMVEYQVAHDMDLKHDALMGFMGQKLREAYGQPTQTAPPGPAPAPATTPAPAAPVDKSVGVRKAIGGAINAVGNLGPVKGLTNELGSDIQGFTGGISSLWKGKPKPAPQEPAATTTGFRQAHPEFKGKIFHAKSVEELRKLPGLKKSPAKDNDLLDIGGKYYQIQIVNGKIAVSKEPVY